MTAAYIIVMLILYVPFQFICWSVFVMRILAGKFTSSIGDVFGRRFRGSRSVFPLELHLLALHHACLSKDTVTMANPANAFVLPHDLTFRLNVHLLWASFSAWAAELSQLLADCDLEIVTMHELSWPLGQVPSTGIGGSCSSRIPRGMKHYHSLNLVRCLTTFTAADMCGKSLSLPNSQV